MKKYLSLLSIPALMTLNSCLQEDIAKNEGQEVTAQVSIALPESNLQSRADIAGEPVDPTLKKMRLYLFVYQGNKIVDVIDKTNVDFTSTVTEKIRLVTGQAYKIAAWADFVTNTGEPYYQVDTDKGSISLTDMDEATGLNRNGNDTKNDAYYICQDVKLDTNKSIELTLKRPFSLVQVFTTDWNVAAVQAAKPTTYTSTIKVPTELSLLTGEVSNEKNVIFSGNVTDESTVDKPNENKLSFDYILTGAGEQSILPDFKMNYSVCDYTFSNIPVKRNYITNIKGNILTKEGNVTVKIDQEWDGQLSGEIVQVAPDMDLADMVKRAAPNTIIQLQAGTYTCNNGITIDKPVKIIGAANNKSIIMSSGNISSTILIKPKAGNTPQTLAGTILDGLTVYGAGKNNGSGVSNAISIFASGTKEAPIKILNCITEKPDYLTPDVSGYNGIETSYGDLGYLEIKGNKVNDTRYGMYFNSIHNSIISGNEINKTANGGIIIAADSREGKKSYDVIIENNTLTDISYNGHESVYCYGIGVVEPANGINLIQRNNTVNVSANAAQMIKDNPIYGFPITEGTLSDIINNTANGGTIILGEAQFDEIIEINTNRELTIIGSTTTATRSMSTPATKIKAAYLNAGNITFENIEFYGAGKSAGSYSTVFAGGTASVALKNCVINVTEALGTQGRPIETAYNAKVNLTMEGCTIKANSAKNAYLNPVSKEGSITVKNCTFVGKGLTAEFNCDANSAKVLPVLEGNNFGGTTVGFSYYANPGISDANGLDFATKMFCNYLLNNNTFTGANKIKVSPLNPSTTSFYVNTPFIFGQGTVIYENTLTTNSGDWTRANFENGETIINDNSSSKSGEYRSQWMGNWTQSLDIYIDDSSWQNGNYICLVSSANSTTGGHPGQDQDLAILKHEDKYLVKLTSSTSGSDSNTTYTTNDNRKSVQLESMNGWYTVTWKYYRTQDGISKCDMYVTKDGSNDKLNEFTFTIPQEIGLNRYLWLTSTESDVNKIMPLKVRNQKIVLD